MSFLKTKMTVALALAVGLLTGCERPVEPQVNADAAAKKKTVDQLNREQELSKSLLVQLQKTDPTLTDAYFALNDKGERTVVLARKLGDGTVQTWQAPAEQVDALLNEQPKPAEATAGTSGGVSGSGLLMGALGGYLLGNMFSSNAGSSHVMQPSQFERERARDKGGYASSVSAFNRQSLRRSMGSSSPSSAKVGTSRGGSFTSSGARSGGYSSGG